MVLTVDIGNSFTKIGLFTDNELRDLQICEDLTASVFQNLFEKNTEIKSTIISSVRAYDKEIVEFLNQNTELLILSDKTKLPFKNLYETPYTLGRDRIAGVAGAKSLYPDENVLVIDAGTCITYDILTGRAEYLGGSISPGIEMRFKALNTFTNKLPLIKAESSSPVNLIGNSTESSIKSGVQAVVLLEVDATIDEYKKRFESLKIVVTGGDLFYFDKYLKNNIFAAPNLVLVGLKKILDFNEGS